MIRILHFAGVINQGDFIDTVLARLDRSRFEVSALTGLPAHREPLQPSELNYHSETLGFEFTKRNYPRMLSALMRAVKKLRPHVIHAHHYHENVVAAIVGKLFSIPHYVNGHHYSDHIYYLTKGCKRQVLLAVERLCNRLAAQIVVPSRQVSRLLVEHQGVASSKVIVIPYGMEVASYRPSTPEASEHIRSEYGLEGKYVALTCCRLNREKGLQYLLQALPRVRSRHSNLHVVMVGSGPFEAELRSMSRDLGVADVVDFVGWQSRPLDWMATADVVLQPSTCESFCQVMVEALALSKPVIMTPVGAAPEVIGRNERGRLVPIGDVGALAEALEELVSRPALGQQLGRAGKAYVAENLQADQMALCYESMYEKLAQGGDAPHLKLPRD